MTALVFAAIRRTRGDIGLGPADRGDARSRCLQLHQLGERRDLVRRFQAQEIRVLTNYNVLSQGFDAPKVGAVYVVRPTFSLNRYQQMIGRGLRGPKNGGPTRFSS